jgi:hypothetical protein
MSEQEINAAIGRKVENVRTGSQFTVIDFHHGSFHLSGGQLIPPDAFVKFWRVLP